MGDSVRKRRRRYRADWRWYVAASFCFLFFLVSLSAFVADLAAFRARSWVEAWTNLVTVSAARGLAYRPDAGDWEGARSAAQLATTLAPLNANYHETLARVYASQQLDLADGSARLRPMLDLADAEYQQSISLRPTWPYGYLGRVYVLRRAGRMDAAYADSLAAALRYGPWEPLVLSSVVDLNIDILGQLQPSTRQLVLGALHRGQGWTQDTQGHPVPYGDQLWGRLKARHRDMVACGWLRLDTPLLQQRCSPPAG